jgi:hypothetical protein
MQSKHHGKHLGGGEWELLYKKESNGQSSAAEAPEFIVRIQSADALDEFKKCRFPLFRLLLLIPSVFRSFKDSCGRSC